MNNPPRGWNSWYACRDNLSEEYILKTADYLVNSKLKEYGYVYVNIDDGWVSHRDKETKKLIEDKKKFPNGIKSLVDKIHAKGLKCGIYTDVGEQTCMGFTASKNYEELDMHTFIEWGIDLVKIDWCYICDCNQNEKDAYNLYEKYYLAKKKYSSDIIISICCWGLHNVWEWAGNISTMWRTTEDIVPNFDSIISIYHKQHSLAKYQKPGEYNDPDMLVLNSGYLTKNQELTYINLWYLSSSPLILSCELDKLPDYIIDRLKNNMLNKIHNDSLQKNAILFLQWNEKVENTLCLIDCWKRELEDNSFIYLILNRSDKIVSTKVFQDSMGFHKSIKDLSNYNIRDIFTNKVYNDYALNLSMEPFESKIFNCKKK